MKIKEVEERLEDLVWGFENGCTDFFAPKDEELANAEALQFALDLIRDLRKINNISEDGDI